MEILLPLKPIFLGCYKLKRRGTHGAYQITSFMLPCILVTFWLLWYYKYHKWGNLEKEIYLDLWFQREKSLSWWGASWQQAGMAARQAAEISNCQTSMKQKELKARWNKSTHPHPHDILPPVRPYFLNLLKQCHQLGTKCSNICSYGGHFSFKLPHLVIAEQNSNENPNIFLLSWQSPRLSLQIHFIT